MTTKKDQYPGPDQADNPDPDQDGAGAIAPVPTASAVAAITSLSATLNGVDTSHAAGQSGLPMLLFKSRGNIWLLGQQQTAVDPNGEWALNPASFRWGVISFDEDGKPTERMVPIDPKQEKPIPADQPDIGAPWNEQWSVNLRCLSGANVGAEVVFKSTTVGGIQAIAAVRETIRDRINSGQHDHKVVPILRLGKSSYPHSDFGDFDPAADHRRLGAVDRPGFTAAACVVDSGG